MALIKCSECGNEISDKAKKCPNCGNAVVLEQVSKICPECGKENSIEVTQCIFCGCPFDEDSNSIQNTVQNSNTQSIKELKGNLKKIIIPIVAVLLVTIIGIIIYNVKVVKPRSTYNEAITLLEKGEYDEANDLFDTIKGYKDVETIQEQLKYESYAYSAINSLKKYLKNPDSYQPYEITFYASTGNEDDNASSSESQITENIEDEKCPVCIMHYGAQNGFGGNTTGYAICSYNDESKEYELLGTCDSLDEDDYDKYDKDDRYDLIICSVINLYRDGGDTIGDIDFARLKTVLKNDAYSTIKIIE